MINKLEFLVNFIQIKLNSISNTNIQAPNVVQTKSGLAIPHPPIPPFELISAHPSFKVLYL